MRFHLTQLLNDLGVPALRFGDAWPAAIYDPESDAVFLGEVCLGTEDDEVLCCEIKRVYPDLDEPVLALRAEPEEGSWRVVFFSLGGKPVSVPAEFCGLFCRGVDAGASGGAGAGCGGAGVQDFAGQAALIGLTPRLQSEGYRSPDMSTGHGVHL